MARLLRRRDDPAAFVALATIALEGGNPAKALSLLTKASGADGSDAWAGSVAGRALILLGRQDEARVVAARLAQLSIHDPHLLDTVGVLLVRTGQHAPAVPLFRRAAVADPANGNIAYNLATTLQFIGDLAGAADAYRAVLAIDPESDRSRLALVQLEPPSPATLDQLAARFGTVAQNADAALLVGHAAAKVAEDLGDPIGAMTWLDRAKAGKARAARYDRTWAEALFAAAADSAARLADAARSAATTDAPDPVFIVGMPRSGTTLVDRIVSSHRQVVSAGELADFSLLLKRASGSPGPLVLDPTTLASDPDATLLGTAYRKRTAGLAGGAARLIDKMPFNLFLVPQILRALPNARVVMLRRDPRDTVFASYRQLFATAYGYYDYAYDLENTAHWVARFNILVDRYADILTGPRYTEVSYEGLIDAQESESRRLIAFCGLDWDPACLDFHSNPQPVTTASSVQVRATIHRASVGRWRRYGDHASHVETALAQNGIRIGAPHGPS